VRKHPHAHTHTHTYTHTHTQAHTHTYTHRHVHARTHTTTHAHTQTHKHTPLHMYSVQGSGHSGPSFKQREGGLLSGRGIGAVGGGGGSLGSGSALGRGAKKAPTCPTSSRSNAGDEQGGALWCDKHAPTTSTALVVHKKKVSPSVLQLMKESALTLAEVAVRY